jgi:hypothetical protein
MKVYTIQRICIYIFFVAALSSACHKHEMEEPVEVLWTDIEQGKTPGRTRVTFVGHIPQEADITDVASSVDVTMQAGGGFAAVFTKQS